MNPVDELASRREDMATVRRMRERELDQAILGVEAATERLVHARVRLASFDAEAARAEAVDGR